MQSAIVRMDKTLYTEALAEKGVGGASPPRSKIAHSPAKISNDGHNVVSISAGCELAQVVGVIGIDGVMGKGQ